MLSQLAPSVLPFCTLVGLRAVVASPVNAGLQTLPRRAVDANVPSTCALQDAAFPNISIPSLAQLNVSALRDNTIVVFSNCTKTDCATSQSILPNASDGEQPTYPSLSKRQGTNGSTWALIHPHSTSASQMSTGSDQPSTSSSINRSTWALYHSTPPINTTVNGSTTIDNPAFSPQTYRSTSHDFYDPEFEYRYRKERNVYLIRTLSRETGRVELQYVAIPTAIENLRPPNSYTPENTEWLVDRWFEPSIVTSFLLGLRHNPATSKKMHKGLDRFFKCAKSPKDTIYKALNDVAINGVGVDSRMVLLRRQFLGQMGSIIPISQTSPTTEEAEGLLSYLEVGRQPFTNILTNMKQYVNERLEFKDKDFEFKPGDQLYEEYNTRYQTAIDRAHDLVRVRLASVSRTNPKVPIAKTGAQIAQDMLFLYSNGAYRAYRPA